MGATNTKMISNKNVSNMKLEVNRLEESEKNEDYLLFEKITQISKDLYSSYKQHFLNEQFCKQLSTIYKKKLFELDIKTLHKIHNHINNSNNSNNRNNSNNQSNSNTLKAVLSYSPNNNEKFIVDEFKTQLREYLWNHEMEFNPKIFSEKGIVLDDIPITIIDPQNKIRYIQINHINTILSNLNFEKKKNKKVLNQSNSNSNSKSNSVSNISFAQKGGAQPFNNNLSNSSSSFSNNSSSSSSSSLLNTNNESKSFFAPPGNNVFQENGINQNINRRNQNQNQNGLLALQQKIKEANTQFGLNQNQNKRKTNQNQNNESNISFVVNNQLAPNQKITSNNNLQQFLNQIPSKQNKPNKINKRELEKNVTQIIEANINRINQNKKISFSVMNYKTPSKFCSSREKCALTKSELCKAITEHFIIRGNIIASILSTLPYKTENGFEGGYCYQRFLNLDKCQICLPHNYNELMSMDPKTRIQTMMLFINYMTEKECVENNGLFRKLTLGEKKSLVQHARNGDEFNILYTDYTQNVRQKYVEHLNILLDILNALSSMEGINNEELNALSLKTKETIDSMVHLCQFYYLYAIIALLNANIKPVKTEESNQRDKLRNSMKQLLGTL